MENAVISSALTIFARTELREVAPRAADQPHVAQKRLQGRATNQPHRKRVAATELLTRNSAGRRYRVSAGYAGAPSPPCLDVSPHGSPGRYDFVRLGRAAIALLQPVLWCRIGLTG